MHALIYIHQREREKILKKQQTTLEVEKLDISKKAISFIIYIFLIIITHTHTYIHSNLLILLNKAKNKNLTTKEIYSYKL